MGIQANASSSIQKERPESHHNRGPPRRDSLRNSPIVPSQRKQLGNSFDVISKTVWVFNRNSWQKNRQKSCYKVSATAPEGLLRPRLANTDIFICVRHKAWMTCLVSLKFRLGTSSIFQSYLIIYNAIQCYIWYVHSIQLEPSNVGLVRTDTSVSISRQQPRSRVTTNTIFLKNGQFLHFISCSRVTAGVNGASETMSTHFHAPNQLIRASAYVRICQGSQHTRNLQCDLICYSVFTVYGAIVFGSSRFLMPRMYYTPTKLQV